MHLGRNQNSAQNAVSGGRDPGLPQGLILYCLAASTALGAGSLPDLPLTVTRMLGTTSQREIMMNRTVPWAGVSLGGVHVDQSKTPNRIYVFDSNNNRILGFYGYRAPRADGTFPSADIVIGQPSLWDHASANGNDSQFAPASDRTLAFIPHPYQVSTAEGGRSGMMATDTSGNLYVADLCNNRILKFNDPFATDAIADDVWGQPDFTGRSRPLTPSAASLNIQWEYGSTVGTFSAGVEVDGAGNLWVSDSGNNRVLRFPLGSKSADLVLGQPSFTSSSSGFGPDQMWKPTAVRLHPVTGELFVLDGEPTTTCRLMVFTPPFSDGMSAVRIIGQAVAGRRSSGLHFARGFALDPRDTNAVWVADADNHRILKFHSQTGSMLDVIGFNTFDDVSTGFYEGPDGITRSLGQPNGEISFDSDGRLFFTLSYFDSVLRMPMPFQRNSQGRAKADGRLLQVYWNQLSGRTMQDHYGMTLADGQLFVSNGQRLLVWKDAFAVSTFQSADFAVGQDSLDAVQPGGTFGGAGLGQLCAAGGWLFVVADARIFVFPTPLPRGGRDCVPYKILEGNGSNVKWADDDTGVSFRPSGLAYDPGQQALWVADNPRNRILRIADPLNPTSRVDLVVGQTNKTASSQNHGLGLYVPDASGLAAPWSLALDRLGNLYAVDAGFEGREDNSGNLRVLRFDSASLVPVPGHLFPNPAASGVFCKPDFTSNRTWWDANRPRTPTFVAFDSQNQMVMLCDSYGNPQGQRAFWFPTPHLGLAPQPSHVITTAFGQAAVAAFDKDDHLIIQDHTWGRIHFYAFASNAPIVAITNRIAVVSASATHLLLRGTNGPGVVGTMAWSASAGQVGIFPASHAWSVEVPLAGGEVTIININGTNSAGFLGSDVLSVARPVLPAPVVVPSGGAFTNAVTVALANFAADVEMRFTADGSEPGLASPAYRDPFELRTNAVICARTFQAGRPAGQTTYAPFDLHVAPPVISPAGGSVTGQVFVTISSPTASAQIRYTVDGREPSTGDQPYSGPFVLDHPATVKAKAFLAQAHPSITAEAVFSTVLASVSRPVLVPGGGLFAESVAIELACPTAGAQIRYTVDGTEPGAWSALYQGSFTLTNGAVVKARGYVAGLIPSETETATFTLLQPWQGMVLPDTSSRDAHAALGSDGAKLYYTRGYHASVPFYSIPKGQGSNWRSLAPLPIPWAMSAVGNLSFFDGALWTLAPFAAGNPDRCVYRYDIQEDAWTNGYKLNDGGVDTAICVVATNRIYGGWNGWDRIKNITNWEAGASTEVGSLPGGATGCWDSCLAADAVYFIKHHGVATNTGSLASVSVSGSPVVALLPGMPFNPGWGAAVEYLPGRLFADGHERLYVLRGTVGTNDGDGNGWTTPTTADQLAIYDLISESWSLATLPFAIDSGSEMCLVDDTLYILAANSEAQPLKMAPFRALTPAPTPPKLNLLRTNGQMRMVWDEAARGFMLERTTNLTPGPFWVPLMIGTNQHLVTPATSMGCDFYRLRLP
jgi:DNA-binding beta-propeller fold protein YncE